MVEGEGRARRAEISVGREKNTPPNSSLRMNRGLTMNDERSQSHHRKKGRIL